MSIDGQAEEGTISYRTTVSVAGGRSGTAISDDGHLGVILAMPKELGGSGRGTNPEQLFAAGFASCLESTVRMVGRLRGTPVARSGIDSTVSLVRNAEGRHDLRIEMVVSLPEFAADVAQEMLDEASRLCPYSRAVHGNIGVSVRLSPSGQVAGTKP